MKLENTKNSFSGIKLGNIINWNGMKKYYFYDSKYSYVFINYNKKIQLISIKPKQKRLAMKEIREIIKLRKNTILSNKRIGEKIGVSKTTVQRIYSKYKRVII